MIMDDDQLYELTKKRRHAAQSAVLTSMGIEHRMRPDGSIVVSQAHVENLLGGGSLTKKTKSVEPNWDMLNA